MIKTTTFHHNQMSLIHFQCQPNVFVFLKNNRFFISHYFQKSVVMVINFTNKKSKQALDEQEK